MANVYDYILTTGVIVADAGEILLEVATEYQNAFGMDLIVPTTLTPQGASTPQGLLIITETLARIAVADNNAQLANQINPNIAGGIFLDAIMALTGIARTPAAPSVVTATIAGVAGTIIPAGSQASDSINNNVFQTTVTVTIPPAGTLSGVIFNSVLDGEIPLTTNTLTNIISAVLGWEQITASNLVSLGFLTQSDTAARQYRLQTLANQGTALPEAITSALHSIGVSSLAFLENIASTTQTIDGVTMVGHSIYVCANATAAQYDAVALSLVNSKSAGAAYNNGPGIPHNIPVTVPFSGQVIPVLFDTPNPIDIYVNISVRITIPIQTPVAAIQQAILNYANSNVMNVPGLGVGDNVSPFEISGAVVTQYPGVYVQDCEISYSSGSGFTASELTINKYEIANIQSSFIAVTVL